MSAEYWLGVATPFAALVGATIFVKVVAWLHWWFDDPARRLGRGFTHVYDLREDGRWYPRMEHAHYWPPRTPWWLIHWLEPLRVRLCLRGSDRLPADEAPR